MLDPFVGSVPLVEKKIKICEVGFRHQPLDINFEVKSLAFEDCDFSML